MTAVEDNRDSLIGCVVWRRNRVSADSDSVVKKSERMKHSLADQPLNSSSVSSRQRVDEKGIPQTKPGQELIRVETRTDCKILGSAGNDNVECKLIETSQVQPELLKSSAVASRSLISPLFSNSSSMSKGHQVPSATDTACSSTILGQTLQVEAPVMRRPQGKPKPTMEFHRAILQLPSDTVKGPFSAPDDDDLPEFDFGAACGISPAPASKMLDAATIEKKLPAENFMKINRTLLSMVPTMQSIPASNQRGHGDFGLGRLPHDAIQRMHLQNEVCEYDKTIALPNLEEKWATKTSLPVSTPDILRSKNLFDDGDDMPEWCPPNAKRHRHVVPETAMPSRAILSSQISNSTSESFPRGPASHFFSPPCPGAYLPSFSQKFPLIIGQNVKPVSSRPCNKDTLQGHNPFMGFSSNPLLRPPLHPFDAELPVRPDGRSSWRP